MRLRYLQTEQGTEAYTVLVQDIPGVPYGTPLHRLDNTVCHLRVCGGRCGALHISGVCVGMRLHRLDAAVRHVGPAMAIVSCTQRDPQSSCRRLCACD